MRLSEITDGVLEAAVRAQPSDEFDSHDVIFWISRNRPRPYAQDLYLALQDEGDPFINPHTAIGRRMAALTHLVQQQRRKRRSANIRGEVSTVRLAGTILWCYTDLRAVRQGLTGGGWQPC